MRKAARENRFDQHYRRLSDLFIFRGAPGHRRNVAKAVKPLQASFAEIEKQTGQFVDLIVETNISEVMAALEERVQRLSNEKILVRERTAKCHEPLFRAALDLVVSLWNTRKSGRLEDCGAVLKPTFADKPFYDRERGFRTPNMALPFKALADPSGA